MDLYDCEKWNFNFISQIDNLKEKKLEKKMNYLKNIYSFFISFPTNSFIQSDEFEKYNTKIKIWKEFIFNK